MDISEPAKFKHAKGLSRTTTMKKESKKNKNKIMLKDNQD